jgi:fucose transport system substrate-binding protein
MNFKVCYFSLILIACSTVAVFANGAQDNVAADEKVVVEYATYRVGAHVAASAEMQVLAEFREAYGDTIILKVEELPSDDAYTNKMKVLAAAKSLPDVVDSKNGLRDLAIKNGQAMDLIPLLNADAEWKKAVGQGAIDYNSTADGQLYSIASSQQTLGYFYNTEMFKEAGITPAKDWDEFLENCELLKSKGYTPIAMQTGENCWTTNLFLAAMVGSNSNAGNSFMNTIYPDHYETPEMIESLTMIKTLLKDYTTSDALGAIYANAANNFCQEQVAMIANGPWMISDFSNPEKSTADFDKRVGVALYPNNSLLSQYEVGWALCSGEESPEDQEGALEFFKFITGVRAQEIYLNETSVIPASPLVPITEEFSAENELFSQLIELIPQADYSFRTFDTISYASVIDAFGVNYPEMVFDSITPEEMAKKLTLAAQKN